MAYVAFTRAKQRLFLSHAQTRRVYGELKYRRPSRFLRELPEHELELIGGMRRESPAAGRATAFGSRSAPAVPRPHVAGEGYVHEGEASEGEAGELRPGMRVRHSKFGVGPILTVSPGSPPRVTVRFPGWGDKTLVSSYLEPA